MRSEKLIPDATRVTEGNMRLVSVSIFAVWFLLAGCATPSQAAGSGGGYSEADLGENQIRVDFHANGFSSPSRARDFAVLRAAEICRDRGYTYLRLESTRIKSDDVVIDLPAVTYYGKNFTVDVPPREQNVARLYADLIVTLLKEKPAGEQVQGGQTFEASYLIGILRRLYDLDSTSSSSDLEFGKIKGSLPALNPGQARIYVYRSSVMGFAVHPMVLLDGNGIGFMPVKRFFYVDRNPGHHVVEIDKFGAGILGVKLEAGQTQYVRIRLAGGLASPHIYAELVDEDVANSEMAGCKFTGN